MISDTLRISRLVWHSLIVLYLATQLAMSLNTSWALDGFDGIETKKFIADNTQVLMTLEPACAQNFSGGDIERDFRCCRRVCDLLSSSQPRSFIFSSWHKVRERKSS